MKRMSVLWTLWKYVGYILKKHPTNKFPFLSPPKSVLEGEATRETSEPLFFMNQEDHHP